MAELSSRMQKPVSAILPQIAATISERTTATPKIDLATAENWLCRSEILDIYREAVRSDLKLTVRNWSFSNGMRNSTDFGIASVLP
jgi:hypothetical protein